jgi:hypothetical protein
MGGLDVEELHAVLPVHAHVVVGDALQLALDQRPPAEKQFSYWL